MGAVDFKHLAGAFVIVVTFIGLFYNIYSGDGGLEDAYGINKGDTKNMIIDGELSNGNIIDQFKAMNLMSGINKITIGISKLDLRVANAADVVGGLAGIGIGILQTVWGLIISPYDVVRIITTYYSGMGLGIFLGVLVQLITVYFGFKFVDVLTGRG